MTITPFCAVGVVSAFSSAFCPALALAPVLGFGLELYLCRDSRLDLDLELDLCRDSRLDLGLELYLCRDSHLDLDLELDLCRDSRIDLDLGGRTTASPTRAASFLRFFANPHRLNLLG